MSLSSSLSRLAGLVFRSIGFHRPRYGARRALGAFLQQGVTWGPFSQNWSENRYEQVRHYKHWVYVAVDRIATEVAMHAPNVSFVQDYLPPTFDARPPSSRPAPSNNSPPRPRYAARSFVPEPFRLPLVPEAVRRKALTPLRAHEQLEPAPANHPLCRLLADPNDPDTSFDLWYETEMFLLLTGTAYWWVPPQPNGTGRPAAAWVLPSHWVRPTYNRQGALDTYYVLPVEGNYVSMKIPAEDVLVFRRKSPLSKIDGYSPQTAAAQWIDAEESVSRCRWFSFKNGIFPGVTVEFDAEAKLPDESDLDRIEAKILARYGSEHNANRPMFVPPGARVKKLSLTPEEMGCFESEEQLRDMILSVFRVPPACVGVTRNMTYGSVQASRVELYSGALNPTFHYLGQNLTEKLARPRYHPALRVWWEDRTPQDPELQEKQLMTDSVYGARNPNEVRALRGLEPIDAGWANEPWMPANKRPVSALLASPLDPSSPPPGSPGLTAESSSDPEGNAPRLHDDNLHVNG